MFSAQTIALIKATVPVLKQHGEAITTHFYQLMLREHPELKAFFNEAHQAHGTQARALAGAVLAYAANIDRLEALAGALPRIIQKHVSLGVEAQHYPIVGQCLLRAIKEVLGEAATDDIIAAWGEAYTALANILIAAEEQVYQDNAAKLGGWRGTRAFKVARKEPESELITSFYLEPTNGGALPAFQPGQYLTLVLKVHGQEMRRNYSLSDAPGKPWLRISVKREAGGLASNWLHDEVQVGQELQVQAPSGDFVLSEATTRPLVLVTGGVGITPAMSMLEANAASGRPIHFIHAARHGGVHAFRDRVDELAAQHANVRATYVYEQPRGAERPHTIGRVTQDLLGQHLPADRDVDVYFIGPKPFMQAIYQIGRDLGVQPSQLRYEFFGPMEAITA
ncbi:MAG: NO-inducible flavohemoprotein [Aquabacterium sp.]|uniref:NO-inducible flavohemoprotein n=1 Tax=Aquabacterium sp. TaxID=1872578 RepID=UPI002717B45A|nr:NO-inducible flavohemoprotein [Aquabacterium sp.]MDO9004495.1 NO-inducible flavohemoprotein [Aquabacterium sp.]